jgi:hypothetical protein
LGLFVKTNLSIAGTKLLTKFGGWRRLGASTKEEVMAVKKKKKRAKPVSALVSLWELKALRAESRTLYAFGYNGPLCPKCEDYVMPYGFVCMGCGYDPSIGGKR